MASGLVVPATFVLAGALLLRESQKSKPASTDREGLHAAEAVNLGGVVQSESQRQDAPLEQMGGQWIDQVMAKPAPVTTSRARRMVDTNDLLEVEKLLGQVDTERNIAAAQERVKGFENRHLYGKVDELTALHESLGPRVNAKHQAREHDSDMHPVAPGNTYAAHIRDMPKVRKVQTTRDNKDGKRLPNAIFDVPLSSIKLGNNTHGHKQPKQRMVPEDAKAHVAVSDQPEKALNAGETSSAPAASVVPAEQTGEPSQQTVMVPEVDSRVSAPAKEQYGTRRA